MSVFRIRGSFFTFLFSVTLLAGVMGAPSVAQDPCIVPDDGSGSVSLPPEGCGYLSPNDVHMIIDGLPPGTEIHLDPIHMRFFCLNPGGPGHCGTPGGPLGGELEEFDSTLRMHLIGVGELEGFERQLEIPLLCQTATGLQNPSLPTQTFPTEMVQLQGALFGDPDFDSLQITAGAGFGLPSPGQTTLMRLGPPGSDFQVDSFFDITYQIDFQGAPGGVLDGLSGSTQGTIRMEAQGLGDDCQPNPGGQGCSQTDCPVGGEFCLPRCVKFNPATGALRVIECDCRRTSECQPTPDIGGGQTGGFCFGECPVGTECHETITQQADGSLDICCDCVPVVPECEPAFDGFGCEPFDCPDPGQECVPVAVECFLGKPCIVVECECRFPNECQAGLTAIPEEPVACFGACPPGFICNETAEDLNNDGNPDLFRCDCEPDIPSECEPNDDGTRCRKTACDIPEDQCVPQVVTCDPNGRCEITECACTDPNRCHIDLDPPSFPFCTGACPPGFECEEQIVVMSDGFRQHKCDCVPVTEACCTVEKGCLDVSVEACAEIGGTPLGAGTVCGPAGPCCLVGDVTALCIDTDPQCCQVMGGVAQPKGEVCTATRACCLGEFCVDVDPSCCDDLGGMTVFGADCEDNVCDPPECEPEPNGLGCVQGACEDPNQRCVPRCVRFDPNTGATFVDECDCRFPNECRVDGPIVVPQSAGGGGSNTCVVVDDGTGTVELPPPGCSYLSPDEVHMIIDGLPAGTTIELGAEHAKFFNTQSSPGGSLGGRQETFDSLLLLDVNGTGNLAGFARSLAVPIACETHTGPRNPGDPVQSFPTDMFGLQGQLFGDPDFCTLRVSGGTNFGMPSPGHTTLTRLGPPGSDFQVDSFFDITYQIEFQGCPGSVLEGMSGTTTGTITMGTGDVPVCEGDCPPGFVCERNVVVGPNGGLRVCCDCVPEPVECGPTPNFDRCAPVDCPIDGQECVPTRVICGPGPSPCRVVECECRNPQRCHVDLDPPFFPFCVGSCPPGFECLELETVLPTDEIEHVCECVPQACEPLPDGSRCAPITCPDPNQECTPREAVCDVATGECEITECDCGDAGDCQLNIVPGQGAFCEGACPPGTVCEEFRTQLPGGQIRIKCECVDAICEPEPDGQRCSPVSCPEPGDECVPILLSCEPGAGCEVVECECMSPNFCHVDIGPNGGPVCEGGCPASGVCGRIGIDVDGDNLPDLFECRCAPPVACCLPDGECAEIDIDECEAAGGVPGPAGSTCEPPKPCCIVGAVIGECDERSPVCCELAGGIVQDGDETCTERVACCLGDGPCLDIDPLCCDELGGTPGGPNSQCTLVGACCLPGGVCEELDRTCCNLAGGLFRGANTSCEDADCPGRPFIVHELGLPGQTRPHSGYVDPKQDVTNGGIRQGLTSCEIRFNVAVRGTAGGGPVMPANFSMTETGGGVPPNVTAVVMIAGDPTHYRVGWDRPLTLQEWTTIRASVFNVLGDPIASVGDLGPGMDEPDRVDFGFLPADTNQMNPVSPLDLFLYRQYVLGVMVPPKGLVNDYVDTDRNGALSPLDLFRYRQLVNGVATTQSWAGQSINNPQP